MKIQIWALVLGIFTLNLGYPKSQEKVTFDNRIKLDSDNKIKYQRRIWSGLYLGPEIGYALELDLRDAGFGMDQRPTMSLFNLAYEFPIWELASESTFRWLKPNSIRDFEVESRVKFPLQLRDNLDLSPYVKFFAIEHWPKLRYVNSDEKSEFRINFNLGLKIELEWKM